MLRFRTRLYSLTQRQKRPVPTTFGRWKWFLRMGLGLLRWIVCHGWADHVHQSVCHWLRREIAKKPRQWPPLNYSHSLDGPRWWGASLHWPTTTRIVLSACCFDLSYHQENIQLLLMMCCTAWPAWQNAVVVTEIPKESVVKVKMHGKKHFRNVPSEVATMVGGKPPKLFKFVAWS